jgi:hypothetical protein
MRLKQLSRQNQDIHGPTNARVAFDEIKKLGPTDIFTRKVDATKNCFTTKVDAINNGFTTKVDATNNAVFSSI